jgi:hypothetical protein
MAASEGLEALAPPDGPGTDGARGLGVHVAAGLAWTLVLFAFLGDAGALGILWISSAILLWLTAAGELRAGRASAPNAVAGWWLRTLVAPLFAAIAVVELLGRRGAGPGTRATA